MGGHGQRPGIEPVDHSGRVLGGRERSFSSRILGLDIDPFIELRHRDPQVDGREVEDRISSPNQLRDPTVAFASEYLSVNALRVCKQDFIDAVDVAIRWDLYLPVMSFGSGRQYLDDEDRIVNELLSPTVGAAGYRQVRDIIRIVPIGTNYPRLGLCRAWSTGAQRAVDCRS